ncbi:MAG TPA: penicillin acylase family protein [Telluria sp.]|nr:penicillin acylase family protein [Telluria sp.]
MPPARRLLPALLLLTMAGGAAGAAPGQVIEVAGLGQPAEILVDRWGVPHIYAQDQDDVFFAQGFNAARDRLFQIDLWRRRGLGELAAVLGPAYVEQDRAARLFLYRGDMQKEWRAYGKDAARISERFVAGINAYVDYVTATPSALPYEFRQLGYAPAKWRADDVVRIRSHGLNANLKSEVARAAVACQAGLAADQVRKTLQPRHETSLPAGLDPCLPAGVLKVFELATQNVWFGPDEKVAAAEPRAPQESMEGSNNWVVAPSRSATGRAILANDPHRAYSTPSLRYIAHLSAPGMDVIGAGEPALPGISIGHNGTIAFGLTIFSIDQDDLYVYQLNPANPLQYKYGGKWEDMRVLNEAIAVKGGQPVAAELLFTRHGPLVFSEPDKQRAYAVRSSWLEPGTAPYFGSIEYMRAKDFTQFRQAMLHWGAPSENQVYADTSGNIGWVPGGLTPIRPNWDGLLPVPGDGRYEWAGFLAGDKLPSVLNPTQGWFASANEMNLPPGYRYQVGFEWPNNARRTRIGEVLGKPGKLSIEDMLRLQNDVLSLPARRLMTLLKPLKAQDPAARAALDLLRGWDAEESAQSAQAALFEVWWSRHLGRGYAAQMVGAANAAAIGQPDTAGMLRGLEQPGPQFGANPRAGRDRLLLASLADAYRELARAVGPDAKSWRWGNLHYSYFAHPMSAMGDGAARARLNVGPFPRQGGADTVNQSSYRNTDFLQTNGPSFRVVIDVGNWDNSRAMNTPGQSGDPDSPHYRDLAPQWVKGAYFPLLYSRKQVEAAAETTIHLQPAH